MLTTYRRPQVLRTCRHIVIIVGTHKNFMPNLYEKYSISFTFARSPHWQCLAVSSLGQDCTLHLRCSKFLIWERHTHGIKGWWKKEEGNKHRYIKTIRWFHLQRKTTGWDGRKRWREGVGGRREQGKLARIIKKKNSRVCLARAVKLCTPSSTTFFGLGLPDEAQSGPANPTCFAIRGSPHDILSGRVTTAHRP
jgi:hypothetical protein